VREVGRPVETISKRERVIEEGCAGAQVILKGSGGAKPTERENVWRWWSNWESIDIERLRWPGLAGLGIDLDGRVAHAKRRNCRNHEYGWGSAANQRAERCGTGAASDGGEDDRFGGG